jgi:hypothetical protein
MPALKAAAVLLFFGCAACRAVTLQSSLQLPDTPAAHQLASWIGAFNTGRSESVDQYLRTSATEDFQLNNPTERQLIDQLYVGRFDLVEIQNSAPLQLTGVLKADDTGDLFEVGADHRHLAASMSMAARPITETSASRLSSNDLALALRERLNA